MAGCKCPKATVLSEIPTQDCDVDLEQLQKFGFQRGGFVFDLNAGTPTDITKKADWLALKTATNDTKVVFTPLIGGDPVITAGDAITSGGGDNSTLNGVEEVQGTNPSNFTGVFKSLSSEVKAKLQELECEKDLVVFPINQNGKIVARKIAEGMYGGFPISSFHISDRNNAGFGTKDTFNVKFTLPARWDNDLVLIDPETTFRPLQDL
ncbi:Minor capsid protein [Flavobacterium sp. phage 1/32]|nr:Minor capsid protein [Flavobacterium sp. phage 1/32]